METRLDKKGLIIRILGSTVLILWLFSKVEWKNIVEIASQGSLFYFIAAAIAIQVTVATSIWKWKILVASSINQDKGGASFSKLGRFYYIGLFFNNFLPGSVGGDVARVYYLGRITGIPVATVSVGFERITSGVALVVIASIASFSMESARVFLFPIFVTTGIILFVFLGIRNWIKRDRTKTGVSSEVPISKLAKGIRNLKDELVKIGEAGATYRKEGMKWWLSVAILSILFQVGMALINHFLFLSFDIHIPWLEMLMIITLISVITMLPISVNGFGVREGCYIFFFKELGVPDEIAVTVSLMFFLLVSLSSIVGGLFWMIERVRKD